MNIQKCISCSNQFSWGTIYKALMIGYNPIQCRVCGSNHEVIFSTRLWTALLTVGPLFIILYLTFPGNFLRTVPTLLNVVLMILAAALGSLLTPYVAKYKYFGQ
ncbi:TIGR04104 family putative zinc finger protein [Virgibacillus doumboii]|uniref:TIGR04104 family putative zinc finger protein n=1 Tax=Virgibacillus doumboii TaxID=2697503 RepID=UPI0013DF00EC|nr:TIGR04104 family putative zinc finger protein [Virgibacillus doumboii]